MSQISSFRLPSFFLPPSSFRLPCYTVFVNVFLRRGLIVVLGVCFLAGVLAIVLQPPARTRRLPDYVTFQESGPQKRSVVEARNRPIEERVAGYVGSDACRVCHEQQHSTWHDSYHRTMTQVATPEAVMGPFDQSLSIPGLVFHLGREGDRFHIELQPQVSDPIAGDIPPSRHQIVLTTGSHHMQVCWFAVEADSRILAPLPFTYLKKDQRWVPRNATFLKPEEPANAEAGRWNVDCIKCHTTHGRPNIKGARGEQLERDAETRVGEFGISCEACHGPGEQHIRFRNNLTAEAAATEDPMVHPGKLSHRLSAHVCGQCHAVQQFAENQAGRWVADGFDFRPGSDLQDSKMRHLIRCSGESSGFPDKWETQFWSDGMIRVSGREFNGLLESPCYQRGEMSCLSCHQMHQSEDDPRSRLEWADDQLATGMESNSACTQCHLDFQSDEALTAHTHHLVNSSGSNCYNCHMPHTTYGLLKAIRSHQIDSPSVTSSLRTGRPNACNQCHLDRTLAWSGEHLSEWYGIDAPELNDDQRSIAASVLWLLSGDAGQRALMAWSYGWPAAQEASGSEWMTPYLAQLLDDPYDAVRYIADHSLRTLGPVSHDYDFVGDPAERKRVSQSLIQQWSVDTESLTQQRAKELLIGDEGALSERFHEILERRDDRPVKLNE